MPDLVAKLLDQQVVLDTDSGISYIGKLIEADARHYELEDVAIYDAKMIKVSLEEYLVECRKNGFPVSRGTTMVSTQRVLCMSAVDGIVVI